MERNSEDLKTLMESYETRAWKTGGLTTISATGALAYIGCSAIAAKYDFNTVATALNFMSYGLIWVTAKLTDNVISLTEDFVATKRLYHEQLSKERPKPETEKNAALIP